MPSLFSLPTFRWLSVVIVCGMFPSAHADDPCEEANSQAQTLLQSLRTTVPANSKPGEFQATESKDSVGNPALYRVEYVIDGKVAAKSDLKRTDESYPIVQASVSKDGKRLAFYFHSGGSSCCKCSYEIQVSGKGFTLTRGK